MDKPELVAAIQAVEQLDSPDASELLEVYADFLQAAGDPRGTLAALQLRNIDGGKAADAWLAEHREQILGPVAKLVRRPVVYEHWTAGWITELSVDASPRHRERAPDLEVMLRLPACACLRRLDAHWQHWPDAPDLPCRASLRQLAIAAKSSDPLDFGELPRLQSLTLHGCPSSLDIVAPNLRWLGFARTQLGPIGELFDAGCTVERVSIEIPWVLIDPGDLAELLRHPFLATLRELELSMEEWPYDDVLITPAPPDSVIEAIVEAAALRQLEFRKFSGLGCWPEQRNRVLAAFASAPGQTYV